MKTTYYLNHTPIEMYFAKNSDNFVVVENPLYDFSGDGEHLVLKIRKKDLTTWDFIDLLSKHIGVNKREFGYAGLKDKDGMTIQNISIHKQHEKKLEDFTHPNIKILEKTYHNNKIKIGHLKGNNFFIRLKKVNEVNAQKIIQALKNIKQFGCPNYFGYQRFGIEKNNYQIGKDLLENKTTVRDKKKRQFFINAYQSYLFNNWLSKRIELSKQIDNFSQKELENFTQYNKDMIKYLKSQKHPFKLLKGDIMHHYPHGRIFDLEDIDTDATRFIEKDIVPTGLLSGKKMKTSSEDALLFEEEFVIIKDKVDGARRFAWIYPEDIKYEYKDEKSWFELSFSLPKGSYATTVLEEILHTDISMT
jgi:tRNA pseudouridine13 synthase